MEIERLEFEERKRRISREEKINLEKLHKDEKWRKKANCRKTGEQKIC